MMDSTPTTRSFSSLSVEENARRIYRGAALAPMVRASTTPLRVLALQYGADFVYTEELIDRSIASSIRVVNETLGTIDYIKDKEKLSKKSAKKIEKEGRAPLLLRIDPKRELGPVNKLVCQMGTGEPELALEASLKVYKDVSAIDINMGCPRKFSVSGGMGSALLQDPDRACRIIRTLTEAVSTEAAGNIPVSAKIRLLKNTSSTLEFIDALIHAGAKAVAVHGRRVGDDCTNPADWETLAEVVSMTKEKHPMVPILINGDFYTRKEFLDFQNKTKSDGVLLGRPALYNTSIFRKPALVDVHHHRQKQQQGKEQNNADDAFSCYGYDSPLLLDKSTVIKEYIRLGVRYDVHHKNVKYVVCEMMNSRRAPTFRAPFLPQEYPGGQTIAKTCSCHRIEDICKVWDINFQTYSPYNKSNSKNTQQIETEAAPAGEHRYLDSYFLDQEIKSPTACQMASIEPGTGNSQKNDDEQKQMQQQQQQQPSKDDQDILRPIKRTRIDVECKE